MSEYDKMHDYLKDQTFYDKFPEAWKVKKLYDKKVESLERQLKEDRRDHLKDTRELLRQLAEAREEVDYAINFFNKNEQFGVVGILKDIKNKLKEKG